MTDTFFQELSDELRAGATKKGHPFRYLTLATTGLNTLARLRTVVLRRVEPGLKPVFYTDGRSKKIVHIQENKRVALLFYHPKKLLQLKVEGSARIVTDPEVLKKYWSGVQPKSRKDYTTRSAPGSPIANPDHVEYREDKNHFRIVEVAPFKIEYLKLQRPNHLRVLFTKKNGDGDGNAGKDFNGYGDSGGKTDGNATRDWNGQFLVP